MRKVNLRQLVERIDRLEIRINLLISALKNAGISLEAEELNQVFDKDDPEKLGA